MTAMTTATNERPKQANWVHYGAFSRMGER